MWGGGGGGRVKVVGDNSASPCSVITKTIPLKAGEEHSCQLFTADEQMGRCHFLENTGVTKRFTKMSNLKKNLAPSEIQSSKMKTQKFWFYEYILNLQNMF